MTRPSRHGRCGAYAEYWKRLDKPKGWKGCSLPIGHKGAHKDDETKKDSTPIS